MAEIIVSDLLKAVLSKLASEATKKYVRFRGIHSELENLDRTLSQVQALLNDASQKEIADEAVRQWLNSLQHIAYDIDDILDDLATNAMHLKFIKEAGTVSSKVRKLIVTCCTNFALDDRMRYKLDNIATKLQDLEKEKNMRGFIVKNEILVRKLLRDEPCRHNFSVVPIVGMGRLGKTTLARLLYDEKQVKDHFELKAWVCVSDDFDSFSISKVIFQSVCGENIEDFADLNLLQVAHRDQIREKRLLLVLDDVWSESYEDRETLVGPFHTCAPGSKIIMTTRKEQLVKKLCYGNLNHLQRLSHDDALCLFAQHALGVDNFESHSKLKPHGEGIVKKCDDLPLALIALGRLLRTKKR